MTFITHSVPAPTIPADLDQVADLVEANRQLQLENGELRILVTAMNDVLELADHEIARLRRRGVGRRPVLPRRLSAPRRGVAVDRP